MYNQESPGQVMSGYIRSCKVKANQVRSGQIRSDEVKTGQISSCQIRTGQGQVRERQKRSVLARSFQETITSDHVMYDQIWSG